MKKIVLIAILVAGLSLISSPVFAFDLGGYAGPIEFKLYDWSVGRQYDPVVGQQGFEWAPERTRAGMAAGGQTLQDGVETPPEGVTDGWTIATITQIVTPDGNELWGTGDNGEYLTAYLYGFDDVYIHDTGTGIQIGSAGGQALFFFDTVDNFNASVANPNVVGVPVIGSDPWGATDGSLFLSLDFVPGITPTIPSVTRWETIEGLTVPFSGVGSGYLAVTGGAYAATFDGNGYLGGAADMKAIFNFEETGRYDFDSKSSDPIKGKADPRTTAPEPTSMLLLGTGFFGLVALRRKK